MVVCTRFEQEIGRKPGTGERKVPFVPLWSSMEEGRQVDRCVRWKWKQDCGIVIVVALTNDLHARQKATMEKG